MEFSIRDFIREIKNGVNARLDMLESLISSKNADKVEILNSRIQVLEAKIDELISSKKEELPSIIEIPSYDLYNISRNNLKNISVVVDNDYCNKVLPSPDEERVDILNKNIEDEDEDEDEDEEEEQVEEQVEQEEEQVEEQVEQEEEQEVEQEEEQEEEQEALTEFEYKGMVLYRDAENKVYQIDDEGELVDTPIGIWNEVKQKVLAIKN